MIGLFGTTRDNRRATVKRTASSGAVKSMLQPLSKGEDPSIAELRNLEHIESQPAIKFDRIGAAEKMHPCDAGLAEIGQIALDEPPANAPATVIFLDVEVKMGGIRMRNGFMESAGKGAFGSFAQTQRAPGEFTSPRSVAISTEGNLHQQR